MAVNKVILVGNVGKDPETRYLDENTPVCKFPMATSEVYRNRDGQKIEQTEWHNIVLWRGLAKVAEQYVKKGAQLYIEGRIRSRSYDDKDGIKRYITEIVGDNMQMLGRKQDDNQGDDNQQYGSRQSDGTGQSDSNGQPGTSQQGTSQQGTSQHQGNSQQGTSQHQGNSQQQSGSQQQGAAQQSGGTQQPGSSQQSSAATPGTTRSTGDPHDAGASGDDPDISGSGDESDDLPF